MPKKKKVDSEPDPKPIAYTVWKPETKADDVVAWMLDQVGQENPENTKSNAGDVKEYGTNSVQKYGTSEGVTRSWETRGRGTHESPENDVTNSRFEEATRFAGFRSVVGKIGSPTGKLAADVMTKIGDGVRLNTTDHKTGEPTTVSNPLLYSDFANTLSKREKGALFALIQSGKLIITEDKAPTWPAFVYLRRKQ